MDNKALIGSGSLVAENVFVSAGTKEILRGATIRADVGKITGLLGRNGAGKTTLLQCVFGTRRADECDVFYNGGKIKKAYLHGNLLSYLPQKPFLPPQILVKDAARQFGVDTNSILQDFPDLEPDLYKSAGDLSGGRERLLSVLLLLLADTQFTLLDEPFTHIMPLHIARLKEIITRQKEKKGIILTDHMYRHLLGVSDLLYLMKEGKTIFINNIDNLVLHGYISDIPE